MKSTSRPLSTGFRLLKYYWNSNYFFLLIYIRYFNRLSINHIKQSNKGPQMQQVITIRINFVRSQSSSHAEHIINKEEKIKVLIFFYIKLFKINALGILK